MLSSFMYLHGLIKCELWTILCHSFQTNLDSRLSAKLIYHQKCEISSRSCSLKLVHILYTLKNPYVLPTLFSISSINVGCLFLQIFLRGVPDFSLILSGILITKRWVFLVQNLHYVHTHRMSFDKTEILSRNWGYHSGEYKDSSPFCCSAAERWHLKRR